MNGCGWVLVHMCLGTREHTWGFILQIPFTSPSLTHIFSQILACSLPSRLGQLVVKSHRSPCICLPSTGITRTCQHDFFFFIFFLESEHRSSYLQGSSLLTDLFPHPNPHLGILKFKVWWENIYRNNTRELTITKILNKFD